MRRLKQLQVDRQRGIYSLSEVADMLGIDTKTLRNRLRELGIQPTNGRDNGLDGRLRVLSAEQVQTLQDACENTELNRAIPQKIPVGYSAMLANILEIAQAKEKELIHREAKLGQRAREIDARIDELEQLVKVVMDEFRPLVEHLIASGVFGKADVADSRSNGTLAAGSGPVEPANQRSQYDIIDSATLRN